MKLLKKVVAALLALAGTAGAAEFNPPIAIELPRVSGNGELAALAPLVWVGQRRIMVERFNTPAGSAPTMVLRFDGRRIDKRHKAGEEMSLLIKPLLDVLLKDAKPQRRAVNLLIDGRVPYRVVTELMFTVGQAGFTDLRFGIDDADRSALVLPAPGFGMRAGAPPPQPPLNLTIALNADVVRVSATSEKFGEVMGCEAARPCTTPRGNFTALTRAAQSIKVAFAHEHTVTLTGDRATPWRDIAQAAAAVRSLGGSDLFPAAILGVAQ